MKELQEIINNKVKSMIDDGSIQEKIEEGIQKSIEHSISSMFANYGDLTRKLEDGLKEGLKMDLSNMPFETYNQQMLVAVKTKMGNMFHGEASQKFLSEIDKTLAPAPKEMTIVELVNQIVKTWKVEDHDSFDEVDEYAAVELEHESRFDWYNLKMWKKKEEGGIYSRRSSSEVVHLMINGDGEIRISHNQSYNPTCFVDHELLVFKLYSAGTIITGLEDFDEDDCDLQLKQDEC